MFLEHHGRTVLAPIAKMPELLKLAELAGSVILEHYENGAETWIKADRSPVTAADRDAEAIILEGLQALDNSIAVVAEEEVSRKGPPKIGEDPFWLVDPLDGTKEFLSRNGEFTVNIALVVDHKPILGIVHAPALDCSWWGAQGQGATRRDGAAARSIKTRAWPSTDSIALASRSHRDPATDHWLKAQGVEQTRPAGSSLKLCLIAEGDADVYPRFGRTMEWDIAAGHAVLAAAGGVVTQTDGSPFLYGKEPVFDNPAFVAWGDPARAARRGL